MSCIEAAVSSSLLGSCVSPSLKTCNDIDSSTEMMPSGSPDLRSSSLKSAGSPSLNLSLSNVNHQHHHSPSRNLINASSLRPVIHVENHSPLLHEDHNHNISVLDQSVKFLQRGSRQKFEYKVKEHVEVGLMAEIKEELHGGFSSFSALSSPPLKRKRPPKLNIPESPGELKMSGLNHKTAKEEIICFEGDLYGFYCKKGKKEDMEDTHKVTTNINGDDQQAFIGVYDGHGGREAADFVAEKLGQKIVDLMLKSGENGQLENAIKAGYLATDQEFLEQGVSSGTCCVTALIKDGCLVVGNAGDCRAVLSRSGIAEALTSDHKPGTEKELKRIENLGGYVDLHHGAWRVLGCLAVSRSIGDLHLKPWVSSEPDTRKVPITSDCEFMILASDGLWEKVSNQEAVDIARPFCLQENQGHNSSPKLFEKGEEWNENCSPLPKARKISLGSVPKVMKLRTVNGNYADLGSFDQDLRENPKMSGSQPLSMTGPMVACKKLVELSLSRDTLDDVSVMIVDLRHFCRK
ncbi:hypothetical protein KI387_021782 [Taxus chinensis]|uniref:protein-serine/threonine phosphatase n=1 Tax=Taxus chinensis TaxID=29808 RepID=A0AA38LCJ3_TAXCH|nr:hypothetical protein KI387_021782 [Taxus chinensis]